MNSDLDLIWGYFEHELEEEEMNGVEQRLKSDPAFQRLFSEQNEIYQSLRKTDVIAFRKKVKQIGAELRKDKPTGHMIIMSYPWLIAAAIGLLCLTTGYFLLRSTAGETTPPPSIGSLETMHDSSYTLVPDTLSVNRINPVLEELTCIHYRCGVLKSVIPENGQTFAPDSLITFICRIEPPDSVTITILDNGAQVILEKMMPSGAYTWQPPHQKGLFYFQLSRDKKLLCTRKFYIL